MHGEPRQYRIRAVYYSNESITGYGPWAFMTVTIRGINNDRRPSTPIPIPTPGPAKPAGFTATAGPGMVTLAWTNPSDSNIIRYRYRQKAGAGQWGPFKDVPFSSSSMFSFEVTGLTPGTEYSFRIRAFSRAGVSALSDAMSATPTAVTPEPTALPIETPTPTPRPAKPTGFTATAGNAQVTLSWTNPNDATITGWKYQRKVDNLAWSAWLPIEGATGSTTTHTFRNLDNGKRYRYKIRAVNAGGDGAVSDTQSATPQAPATPVPTATATATAVPRPAKPTGFTATAGNEKVTLTWTSPNDNTITKWQYQRKEGASGSYGGWTNLAGSRHYTTRVEFTGLTNGVLYGFKIRAVNASGNGAVSDEQTATPSGAATPTPAATPAPTPAPTTTTVTTTGGSQTIQTLAEQAPGNRYYVELTNAQVDPDFTDPATASGVAGVTVGDWTHWRIVTTGKAKATFVSGGQTTLFCRNAKFTPVGVARAGFCDGEGDGTKVRAWVQIPGDSGDGVIRVYGRRLDKPADTGILSIAGVKAAKRIAALTLKPTKTSIPAVSPGNTTTVRVAATNSAGGPVSGGTTHDATLTTTLGVFTAGCNTNNTQVCQVDLDDTTGARDVTLTGGGVAGVATLRVTLPAGGIPSATAAVTFHGVAAKITVAAESEAVQVGGKTFVVVTVTDAGGVAVPGKTFAAGDVTVAGPTTAAVKVTAKLNVPKEVGTPNGKATAAGELPHCLTGNLKYDAATKGYTSANATATDIAGGTNGMGKCVIEVTAPKTPTTATRGAHTVTVKLNATTSATATVNVRGAPRRITTDAPESVAALSSTKVTITVHDDAEMPVGAVPVAVDQISKGGKVTSSPTMTANGVATFTYVAGLDGVAVFRVTAGTGTEQIAHVLRIRVGAGAAADDDDDGDDGTGKTWNKPPSADEPLLVWEGPNGADPAKGAVEGVVAIWQRTGDGWLGYFPDAGTGASTLETLTQGEAYWVVVR